MKKIIRNGAVAQYRKVGKCTVRFHECPAEYARGCALGSTHQYLVHFRTGRYAGQSKLVWLPVTAEIVGA